MDKLTYIRARVTKSELLAQLAEEASELSQAALKLRRAMDGMNPTPLTKEYALARLEEEFADVLLCAELAGVGAQNLEDIDDTMQRKLTRWANRLRQARK